MRNAFMTSVASIVAVGALGIGSVAVAQLPTRHSGDFNHKYDGDVVPVPNYTKVGAFGTDPISDGDIMTYRVPTGGGYLDSDDWDGTIATNNGWTIEFRIQIDTDFPEGPRGAVALYTGSGVSGDIMSVGQTNTKKWAHSDIIVDTNNNTDAFHTFRVAFDRQGTTWPYTIYRDGQLLDTSPNGGNWGTDVLYFGSAGSPYGGPTVHLDYLRFDDTGAYAPAIPEVSFTNVVVNDTMGMEFDSDDGATYQLEYSEPPMTNDWIETAGFMRGDGGSLIFFDPTGVSTTRLYRIVRTD